MTLPLILLHEEALRMTHPVFRCAPEATRAIYIWDDAIFRDANYSLKRLVFIYETLCELPIDCIAGKTSDVIMELRPSILFVPATTHPLIVAQINSMRAIAPVIMCADTPFVMLDETHHCTRFFSYWRQAEKTAFLHNAGQDA